MNKFEKTLAFIHEAIQPTSPFYGKIYLVGGCVRDELLGERYTDLDLLIDLPDGQKQFVEWMCASFPDVCKGPFYYQRYGTTAMDVVIDGALTLVECVEPHIETYADDGVTLLETRFCTLQEDALRRDYTCNALYKNLHTGLVIDPTGQGIADLQAKVLRTPLEPAVIFKQDPVRMLRGIRFKSQKGFTLDPLVWHAIGACHEGMALAQPKRIRDELNKILKSRLFGTALCDLYYSGMLPYVMPGLGNRISAPKVRPYLTDDMNTWQHTLRGLSVQSREHPHTNTTLKLALLICHLYESEGRAAAADVLLDSHIGKEKVISAVHIAELYWRYFSFFDHGTYVAKPRMLPHFITGLQRSLADFRRMVRALNNGMRPEYQLPLEPLMGKPLPQAALPAKAPSRRRPARNNGQSAAEGQQPSTANIRTQKRREQRKRARARARAQQASSQHTNIEQS